MYINREGKERENQWMKTVGCNEKFKLKINFKNNYKETCETTLTVSYCAVK